MKTTATRTELLARKNRIALAEQGLDLLEKKRAALLKEIIRVADEIIEEANVLQAEAGRAQRALARAEAVAGPAEVHSAALAARGTVPLNIETANVMGIKIPYIEQRNISRPLLGRGYSPMGNSTTIDEAAMAFEQEVNAIIRLANRELRLVRLTAEIQRTSRRVNALKHLLIPGLKAECATIQLTLDERERSDRFRLKLVKRLLKNNLPKDPKGLKNPSGLLVTDRLPANSPPPTR